MKTIISQITAIAFSAGLCLPISALAQSRSMSQGEFELIIRDMGEARERFDVLRDNNTSLAAEQESLLEQENTLFEQLGVPDARNENREAHQQIYAKGLEMSVERLISGREALIKSEDELATIQRLVVNARRTLATSPILGDDPEIAASHTRMLEAFERSVASEDDIFAILANSLDGADPEALASYNLSQLQLAHSKDATTLLREQIDGKSLLDQLDGMERRIEGYRTQVTSARMLHDQQLETAKTIAAFNAMRFGIQQVTDSISTVINDQDPIGLHAVTSSSLVRWMDTGSTITSSTSRSEPRRAAPRSLRSQGY